MSGWQQIALVARRDFSQRATSRPFLMTLVLIVGFIVIGGPLLADAVAPDPARQVGLVGSPSAAFQDAFEVTGEQVGLEPSLVAIADRSAGLSALEAGDIDVLTELEPTPGTLVWQSNEDPQLAAVLLAATRADAQARAVQEVGLTASEASALLAPRPPATEIVDPVDPEETVRQAAVFIGMILLYFAVVLFGQFVMLGVVEEKSSRVVEVVLSRVLPYRLLAGKVIGIGSLAVVQIVALGVSVFVAARLAGSIDDFSLDPSLLVSIVGWFLVGFAFFAVLYAALGATVTRQEDVQSVALLPLVLVLPAYFIAIVAGNDPNALLVRVTSLVPPLSPFVMPVRAAGADVPAWEVGLSVVLLLAATYGMIRLAGRIYTGAILSIGQKVSLRDAWRSSAHVPTQ